MGFMLDRRICTFVQPAVMARMHIGRQYWDCNISNIPDGLSYKTIMVKYMANIVDHMRNGRGLIFHGDYSTGKTAAAVIIAKEVGCYGGTAYFLSVPEILDVKFKDEMFDVEEDTTVWERMMYVDLLILDDIGSETINPWTRGLLERLIRARAARDRAIICTTNRFAELDSVISPSVLPIVRTRMLPVLVEGKDWRKDEEQQLSRAILGDPA